MKKRRNIFRDYGRMLALSFRVAPGTFIVYNLINIVTGLAGAGITIVIQQLFDAGTALATGGPLSDLLWALGIVTATCLGHRACGGIANYLYVKLRSAVVGRLSYDIHQKAARMAPVDFENTDLLDDINKAEEGAQNLYDIVDTLLALVTFHIPYATVITVYLYNLKPELAWAMIFITVPFLVAQFANHNLYTIMENTIAPVRRQMEHYRDCLTGREYFKETRMWGGSRFFRGLYEDALALTNKTVWKATLRKNLIWMFVRLFSVVGYMGTVYMLFRFMLTGDVSAGAFAAVFASLGRVFDTIEDAVCWSFVHISYSQNTAQNYLRFTDIPEREGDEIDLGAGREIRAENLSFTYPGSQKPALDGVSLALRNGETVAIVGENGSGKSTLVRLLTGLYLPQSGTVEHNGHDIRDVSMPCTFRGISAVFQKYQRYQMTLSDNLRMADWAGPDDDATLDKVCAQAGVETGCEAYPQGYDTLLSREFGGVDLSGGQWQRVAIARSFFRQYDFIVLDEPTAAIDPMEETQVYNRFAEISRDKTAVIVTHRLGSVKLADRILVMREGKLVEEGGHEALLAMGGEYARMYRAQRKWYEPS